jgi:hypothetical protein
MTDFVDARLVRHHYQNVKPSLNADEQIIFSE